MNGLSDAEVVRALYLAARDGVVVDLVVRGVCTLRPGVPGLSAGIRVLSMVGRFLEHSRIYRFANGGDAEYLIGSADLRPRNLRQRVELLVPVRDATCRAALDRHPDPHCLAAAWKNASRASTPAQPAQRTLEATVPQRAARVDDRHAAAAGRERAARPASRRASVASAGGPGLGQRSWFDASR